MVVEDQERAGPGWTSSIRITADDATLNRTKKGAVAKFDAASSTRERKRVSCFFFFYSSAIARSFSQRCRHLYTSFVCFSIGNLHTYINIHLKCGPIGFDSTNVPYIAVMGSIFNVTQKLIVSNHMIERS